MKIVRGEDECHLYVQFRSTKKCTYLFHVCTWLYGRYLPLWTLYYNLTYCNILSDAFRAELAVLMARAVEPVMMFIVCRATLVTGTFLSAVPSHE